MTKAEKMVQRFFDGFPNGQVWPEGFEEALIKETVYTHVWEHHGHSEDNVTRYEFDDGSCIVETGGAWDYGHNSPADCGCWACEPHYCRG